MFTTFLQIFAGGSFLQNCRPPLLCGFCTSPSFLTSASAGTRQSYRKSMRLGHCNFLQKKSQFDSTLCGIDFWHGADFENGEIVLLLSSVNPIHAVQSLRTSCRIYGRLSFEILCRRYSAFAQCMFSTELKE